MTKFLQIWRVAEILDCSKRFVYFLIEKQELKSIKLGIRGLRVDKRSLDEYIDKNVNQID